MQYEVKTIKKVGIGGYENEMNSVIKSMTVDGWKVQQILGSPDQGFVILFAKEKQYSVKSKKKAVIFGGFLLADEN